MQARFDDLRAEGVAILRVTKEKNILTDREWLILKLHLMRGFEAWLDKGPIFFIDKVVVLNPLWFRLLNRDC